MMNVLVHTSLVKWDNNIYVVVGRGLFPGIAGITVLFFNIKIIPQYHIFKYI